MAPRKIPGAPAQMPFNIVVLKVPSCMKFTAPMFSNNDVSLAINEKRRPFNSSFSCFTF